MYLAICDILLCVSSGPRLDLIARTLCVPRNRHSFSPGPELSADHSGYFEGIPGFRPRVVNEVSSVGQEVEGMAVEPPGITRNGGTASSENSFSGTRTAAIEITNLVKVYSGDIRALDGISCDVTQGQLFGLLGPNGAGKTTTIRILATLLDAT